MKFICDPEILGNERSDQIISGYGVAKTPNERTPYSQCNKPLVEKGVSLCSECWNKRHEEFHDPEFQKKIDKINKSNQN